MIKEIRAKSAISYHESETPNNWDLNTYRGCGHKCIYCFAQYSHNYLNSNNFFGDIYVKTNIAEMLHIKLKSRSWKKDQIKIGGVTDSYQPIEKRYRLMPDVLKVVKRHRNPILLATKSDLILRDFEIISEISGLTEVDIVTTVTTMDEDIRKIIEPNAPPSIKRFKMLKQFDGIVRSTTVLLLPVLPFITDNYENLDSIFQKSQEHNVDNLLIGALHLRGDLKKKFLDFIRINFPQYPLI